MVDCRPGAGAPPHELAHTQPNGGAPTENHHTQAGGSGDMGSHSIASPASVRSSTPASTNTLTTYTTGDYVWDEEDLESTISSWSGDAMNPGVGAPPNNGGYTVGGGGPGCAPYVCGVKSVVWCGGAGAGPVPHSPHAGHMPPPPPPGVNPHVFKSVQPNGSDLPLNDMPTLRFYYNQGIDCVYGTYGAPPPPPPRHYSPRDLSQDMQQITLHDRPLMTHTVPEQNHKHKPGQPNDKPQINQGKGNGQRPLLGPRFKRGGGNQDGNQNNNHNQNKHNNNMGNKGPNNRRNSHGEARGPHVGYGAAGEGECVMEQPLLTLPYIPYPPPMYPIQYYPVETDPAMMGMMGGMSYVGYDEGVYDAGMQPYYPAPHYPPPHAHAHHIEHK